MMILAFNTFSVLLLLPFTQGLLFAILLMSKTQDRFYKSNVLLGIILLLLSIRVAYWMLGFAGWYDSHDAHTSFMFYFPFNTICLLGPLIYFYFLSVTNQNFKFEKKHIYHLWLPVIWAVVIVGKLVADYLCYFPFQHTVDFQFGTKGPYAEIDKSLVFNFISYSSLLFYLFKTFQSFKAFKQYAGDNLSSLEHLNYNWLRNILVGLGAGIVMMFVYQVLNWFRPLSYKTDWYSYMFLGILIYYIGLKGYISQNAIKPALYFAEDAMEYDQKFITDQCRSRPEDQNRRSSTEKMYLSTSGVSIPAVPLQDLDKWVDQLSLILDQQKPYLIPDLTLNQLAGMVNLNSVLLSKVINTGYQLNFNDFVNSYRVKEVLARIEGKQNKSFTLLSIALESGFNSKATFNRAFKKYMGKTPVDHIRELEGKV